jgi:hypothetical protein
VTRIFRLNLFFYDVLIGFLENSVTLLRMLRRKISVHVNNIKC